MTTSQSAGNAHEAFSRAFFDAFVAAITQATGSPWLVSAVPDAEPTADESEPVGVKLSLDGNLSGECLLRFGRREATKLASSCLHQAAAEFGPEQSQALLKVLEAAIAAFTASATSLYGSFTMQTALTSGPLPDVGGSTEMTAGDEGGNRVSVKMSVSRSLDESLGRHSEAGDATDPKREAAVKEIVTPPEAVNFDLVMDVELSVTLRFGQRQLALREVLELTSGSVIELDRQVEEPVELLLEGKVIARGEAVVIDGNYGLRVTEVPQPVSSQLRR